MISSTGKQSVNDRYWLPVGIEAMWQGDWLDWIFPWWYRWQHIVKPLNVVKWSGQTTDKMFKLLYRHFKLKLACMLSSITIWMERKGRNRESKDIWGEGRESVLRQLIHFKLQICKNIPERIHARHASQIWCKLPGDLSVYWTDSDAQ